MKLTEMKIKTTGELKKELEALRREQFNLRMQKGLGQPPRSHLFKKIRKAIAQIETIMNEGGK